MAVLVVTAYITGGNPVRHEFQGQIHIASGMLIAGLFLIRLVVRVIYRRHIPHHAIAKWQSYLASAVHILLYLCMILIPVTGFMALSQLTEDFSLLGWAMPLMNLDSLPDMGETHELLGQVFIGLAGIHAAAGLAHHFFWKDGVLKSMSPH